MSLFFKRRDASGNIAQSEKPFGTLLSIRHESSGGSMAYRSEFEIELTGNEIVRCAYWPQEDAQEMARREHVPVTSAQWNDVAQTVQTLWPLFHEVKTKPSLAPPPDLHILDGGDYSRWFLTRQTADGVRTAQYYQPDDRRIGTLIALLQELAQPTGREIPRYDPPALCGVYAQFEKEQCSYQCTPWGSVDGAYRFIAYEKAKHEKQRSLDVRVPDAFWEDVNAFLDPLQLDCFPAANSKDAATCTLYFSDGKQKRVTPDRRTSAKLQTGFAGLTDRVRKEYEKKEDN